MEDTPECFQDPAKESAWLTFTELEYYHRCFAVMQKYGMGSGDIDMILAEFWSDGFDRGATATHYEK